MRDERLKTLAKNLVNYSCKLQKGENCLIEMTGADKEFVNLLVEEVYAAGGNPFVWLRDATVERALLMHCNEKQLELQTAQDAGLMRQMQAYIGVRASENSFEYADVPVEQLELHDKIYGNEVHGKIRVPATKWVVLRYPNNGMSQLARMSTESFEDFYFNVCNLDYNKMSVAMDPLVALMERTDKVHIVGKGTDLRFSIKGIKAVKCDGGLNIPDGEIYTAPVRDSIEGTISYNTPAVHQGLTFENTRFTFKNGKIVEATSNHTERINKILDADEGARYVGEFSFGVNPYINDAILDTLFDEKIAGSIHFTPGSCYDDADNGNKSSVHWDLVYIQTPAYGGGEIYFDDVLIRKDGLFVPEALQGLNPDHLL